MRPDVTSVPMTAFCMVITPFKEDRSLDEDAMRAHLQRVVDGRNGIYLGSPGAGEGHMLTVEEYRRIFQIGVEVGKGKVPVYANIRESRSAEQVIELAREAIGAGVDAIQLYGLSPGQVMILSAAEVEAYYRQLLEEIDHPVVLSTSPEASKGPAGPDLLQRLCRDFPQIVAVNNMVMTGDQYMEYRDSVPPHIPMYGSFFAFGHWLTLGANGYVTAEGNVMPRTTHKVIESFQAGDWETFREATLMLHRFSVITREFFPATARPTKMALRVLGLGNGVMRPPYLLPPEADFQRMAAALDKLGVREYEGLA